MVRLSIHRSCLFKSWVYTARLQAWLEEYPLVLPFTDRREKTGGDDFSLSPCSSSFPWFWFQCCAGNPWASCRGDRLVGAGQVHRRYWQCQVRRRYWGRRGWGHTIRRWGWYRSLWMESHSSEKAPLLCFLQWSSRWLLLHPAQTVKGSPLVEFSWLQSAVPYEWIQPPPSHLKPFLCAAQCQMESDTKEF